jgi:lipopolysaccharide transport system ATP-binding protein
MSAIIKAENISKAYQLGQIGTGTLSRDIERMFAKMRGKEDPFLKIGEANDRSVKGSSDVVWSLQDINFEIQAGDAVGIIGKNGAGKSTLLKILSRITSPTTGKITINGRIASLLEVGTGFHPELSGRENIYLNGAILGMRKAEIKKKFDEIVDFAGVERYIDTPVKRYSSGMYVRLAFAVAAHLEPEILVVDEVLAVGDFEFQKKCLGKMKDVSSNDGRTILFVSHNMAAISNLCSKAMLLKNGRFVEFDDARKVIESYMQTGSVNLGCVYTSDIVFSRINPKFNIEKIYLTNNKIISSEFGLDEDIAVVVEYEVLEATLASVSIHLLDKYEECILATFNADSANTGKDPLYNVELKKGKYQSTCVIPKDLLNESTYKINVFLSSDLTFNDMTIALNVLSFQTHDTNGMSSQHIGEWTGQIRPKLYWNTVALS